jgi:hypothetical protein
VRWRVARQPTTESFALRILHPVGDGSYVATGTSLTRTASTTWTEVFPTALPIQAGDLIGLEPKAAKPILEVVQAPGLTQSFWEPTLSDNGIAAKPKPITDIEFPFNADVQPAPQVSLVAPASGPVGGGTVVTIAGTGFDAITGVRFGDAAAHFTLDSESRITATAPGAPEGAGEVDVVVTGFAGTSSIVAADRFTYVGPLPPCGAGVRSPSAADHLRRPQAQGQEPGGQPQRPAAERVPARQGSGPRQGQDTGRRAEPESGHGAACRLAGQRRPALSRSHPGGTGASFPAMNFRVVAGCDV